MDNRTLRNLLGSRTFDEALTCLESGRLRGMTSEPGIIRARVAGDYVEEFTVEIELDAAGEPESLACSCGARGTCPHMGAALLQYIKKTKAEKASSPAVGTTIPAAAMTHSGKNNFTITADAPVPVIELDVTKTGLQVQIRFEYRGRRISPHDKETLIYDRPDSIHESPSSALRRDLPREEKFLRLIREIFACSPVAENPDDDTAFTASLSMDEFSSQFGETLTKAGVISVLRGHRETIRLHGGTISYILREGPEGYTLTAAYTIPGGKSLPVMLRREHIARGAVKTPEGFAVISGNDAAQLRGLIHRGMDANGSLQISRYNLPALASLSDILLQGDREVPGKVDAMLHALNRRVPIEEYPVPVSFTGTLRKYQYDGYRWLRFLCANGLNGCLADDMGLGKTVQTIAFLASRKEAGAGSPSLLVLPVVTLSNWEQELRKFAPSLSFLLHCGPGRGRSRCAFAGKDLILVSYQTLRNDIELFRTSAFDCVVLDEAQTIKNPSSKISKAVRNLSATHRLSLTGTPVENSPLDLWSQMEFLNPGLPGPLKKFRTNVETNTTDFISELKHKTAPFILRRRKEEVLSELPPKEEITVFTDMGDSQRKIYDAHAEAFRASLRRSISEKGMTASRTEIWSALLKLRQICLFPALVGETYRNAGSCKFDALRAMVEELLEEGHRALVFSQFVTVLSILRSHLDTTGIPYAYIDGSTPNREREIRRFQDQGDIPLFLVSLKAGGVGINLTAADSVILFDPWWNPAVEAQAVDRAHRIGQHRNVTAFRLIVRDSVEEKILALQEKKKLLAEDLIAGDQGILASLSGDDIIKLFA
jgi:superfamily II DNA or RNA helicase